MKKKIILITLLTSLFILSSLIGIFFIKDVKGISQDIDYTFDNDYIYNSNDGFDYDYFNIRNKTVIIPQDNYTATYDFLTEIDGTSGLDIDFVDIIDTNANVIILNSLNGHNKILYYNCTISNHDFKNMFSIPQESGTIEFWIRLGEVNLGHGIQLLENNTEKDNNRLYVAWQPTGLFQYFNGTYNTINTYIANTWYHIRIDFECGNNEYMELEPAKFRVFINNVEYGNYGFHGNPSDFECISITSSINTNMYFDAIGYSWDNNGIYEATYSFTDDINWEIPNDFYNLYGSFNATVIQQDYGHSKIIKYHSCEVVGGGLQNDFDIPKISGVIEFYCLAMQTDSHFMIHLKEGNDIFSISMSFNNIGKITAYNNTSVINLQDYEINTWYHIKIIFNCTNDKFDIYINNILKAEQYTFRIIANSLLKLSITIHTLSDTRHFLVDAIGYSWDDDYTIGQNLLPTEYYKIGSNLAYPNIITTEIQEIDKCEFAYNLTTFEPNTDDSKNIDNNWLENDDSTKSHVKTFSDPTSIIIDYFATQEQDTYGIYKEFNYNVENIFNVSFNIEEILLYNPKLDGWYFNIYTYDDTLLVSLLIKFDGSDVFLYYYDGVSYQKAHKLITWLTGFFFNIYINNNRVILRLNDNNINYIYYFSELTTKIGINKIEVIGGHKDNIGDYASIVIDSIGLYINGSSYLPDDLLSIIVDTDIEQWNDNIHNLFEINGFGNFSFSIFYDDSFSYNVIPYSEFIVMKRIYAYDLDIFKGYGEYTFVLISNTLFIISEILVYANSIKENSNIYYGSFSYSNINISENYFYVKNNRLYFTHNANENDTLEYIQLQFNIDNVYALNGSINFNTYFLGISKAYFINNYVSNTNSTFPFRLGSERINLILPQQQIIKGFTILITDNNNNDYYGNSEGFISSIKLIYYPDIELTILTVSLIEIMIPLIVLLIPTLAISSVYGKKAIIPMLILMTLICFISNLINVEIFFIMMLCLGSALFLQYKKERENK